MTNAETIDDLIEAAERFAAHEAQRRGELEAELALTHMRIAAVEEALTALREEGSLRSATRVDAQEPPASPPPSEPAVPNSADASGEDATAPGDSSSGPPSPSRGSRQEQARRKAEHVDAVVEVASRLGGRVSKGAMRRESHVPLSDHQVIDAVAEAVRSGRLEKVGKGAGTRYVAVERKTPATPPAERRRPGTATERTPGVGGRAGSRQPPTLEGRILSACRIPQTRESLVRDLEVSVDQVTPVIGKLMRDGYLRCQRRSGEIRYSAVVG